MQSSTTGNITLTDHWDATSTSPLCTFSTLPGFSPTTCLDINGDRDIDIIPSTSDFQPDPEELYFSPMTALNLNLHIDNNNNNANPIGLDSANDNVSAFPSSPSSQVSRLSQASRQAIAAVYLPQLEKPKEGSTSKASNAVIGKWLPASSVRHLASDVVLAIFKQWAEEGSHIHRSGSIVGGSMKTDLEEQVVQDLSMQLARQWLQHISHRSILKHMNEKPAGTDAKLELDLRVMEILINRQYEFLSSSSNTQSPPHDATTLLSNELRTGESRQPASIPTTPVPQLNGEQSTKVDAAELRDEPVAPSKKRLRTDTVPALGNRAAVYRHELRDAHKVIETILLALTILINETLQQETPEKKSDDHSVRCLRTLGGLLVDMQNVANRHPGKESKNTRQQASAITSFQGLQNLSQLMNEIKSGARPDELLASLRRRGWP